MIKRHSVTIQQYTTTSDSEGIVSQTFTTLKTIRADVQPKALSQTLAAAWGVTDLAAQCKLMFYTHDASIVPGMRVLWDGKLFEIRGINEWPEHDEAILVPVQGAA